MSSNSIYTCKKCGHVASTSRELSTHVYYKCKMDIKEYYAQYISSRTGCLDCGCELHFHGLDKGYKDRCKSCAKKHSWLQLSDSEKQKRTKQLNDTVKNYTGRPKGSKNTVCTKGKKPSVKDPYWLNTPESILKRQTTMWNKTDEEIQEMLNKQSQTLISNSVNGEGVLGSGRVKTYKGPFKPKNPSKYRGDSTKIVYRSGWERYAFGWCDTNTQIVKWSSEEVVIPYRWDVDKRTHRYFPDLLITYKDGRTILIEIKPHKETQPPKRPDKSRRYINEATTYVKNQNKWEAAEEYAKDRGWTFQIWTEKTLTEMGIMPTQVKKTAKKTIKPLKPMKPYRKKTSRKKV